MNESAGMNGAIAGTVSADNTPLANVVVMISGDSPEHADIAAITGPDGAFSFAGLQPGTYALLLNSEQHGMQRVRVTVRPGATATPHITLT